MKETVQKIRKTTFAVLLSAIAVISANAQNPGEIGYKFKVGKIYYKITSTNPKEVEVTFQKDDNPYYDGTEKPTGEINIPQTVNDGTADYTVTRIGDNAFYSCKGITKATIPETVISIGEEAFEFCHQLKNINIPAQLKSIGEKAFNEIAVEGAISLPATLEKCGTAPFALCEKLTAINVDAGNTHYISTDGILFTINKDTLLQYPAGKTETSYSLPTTVKVVENKAFFYATKLQNIIFNEGLKEIKKYAFAFCSRLTNIDLPNSLTTLNSNVFTGCNNLKTIKIGKELQSMGNDVFGGCGKIESYIVNPENPNYASKDGVLFNKAQTVLMVYPPKKAGNTYTVPNGVTVLGFGAFSSNKNLETVNLPEGLLKIGRDAFRDCSNISNLQLPNSLNRIVWASLGGMTKLTSLTIPANVKDLGSQTFIYTNNLTTLTILVQNPEDIDISTGTYGTFSFFNKGNCTLKVPAGCKSKYQAYSKFAAFKTIKELPPVAVTAVSLNKSTLKLNAGAGETLIATISPANATNKKLTWKSSDENIAKVDANGMVTVDASATEGASCDITATAHTGEKAVCKITVDNSITPVSSIALSAKTLTMYVSQKQSLTATVLPETATDKTVTWTSSKLSVATVNLKTGEITAVGYGEADITAYAGSKSIVCKLTVNPYAPLNGISLEDSDLVLSEGEEKQLIVKFNPSDASNQNISCKSDNESVAGVDANGLVTGISEGIAHIIVTTEDGNLTDTCTVTVSNKSTGIEDINSSTFKLYPNPVKDGFTIETSERGILEIYNLSGSKLLALPVTSDKQFIDVSHLQSGIYFAKINGKTIKFVKK